MRRVKDKRCSWLCNIGVPPIYRCDRPDGHEGPHTYGPYCWPPEKIHPDVLKSIAAMQRVSECS